ncbi:NUDIX domain-containing protein [Candidatus Woesearchaeota archaeon]|nr:NUDIX domain-containing protein [Candidatus Woesearchaeota archaeon]
MKTDLVVEGVIMNNNKTLLIHHRKLNIWVPAGGHIDENEVPDDALLREIKEETQLDVEIINNCQLLPEGNTRRNLAVPFHSNLHSVGDHDHCCFFYLCKALNPENLKINKESIDYKWISKEEVDNDFIPAEIKKILKKAFEEYEKIKSNSSSIL